MPSSYIEAAEARKIEKIQAESKARIKREKERIQFDRWSFVRLSEVQAALPEFETSIEGHTLKAKHNGKIVAAVISKELYKKVGGLLERPLKLIGVELYMMLGGGSLERFHEPRLGDYLMEVLENDE